MSHEIAKTEANGRQNPSDDLFFACYIRRLQYPLPWSAVNPNYFTVYCRYGMEMLLSSYGSAVFTA